MAIELQENRQRVAVHFFFFKLVVSTKERTIGLKEYLKMCFSKYGLRGPGTPVLGELM